MYKLKKRPKDFFLYSSCNIFLTDNRFGSDPFVYIFVYFVFFFLYSRMLLRNVCEWQPACPCNKWTYWLGDLFADKNWVIAPSSPFILIHYVLVSFHRTCRFHFRHFPAFLPLFFFTCIFLTVIACSRSL